MTPPLPLLSLHKVCFFQEWTIILRNITLDLHWGECVILQGNNGAGKTTLLKIMAGLLSPHSGQRIRPPSQRYLGHLNGIKKNHCLHHFLKGLGAHSELRKWGESLIQWMGLSPFLFSSFDSLSAGTQRRVALVETLTYPAAVYFLDEPFHSLDLIHQTKLLNLFQSLQQGGASLVISDHGSSALFQTHSIKHRFFHLESPQGFTDE